MKKVIYLFVVSMMMVVTACSSKGGGSSSGGGSTESGGSSDGSGNSGPEYELVDKMVATVNDFAVAYKAGDNAKQEELVNEWIKIQEEGEKLTKKMDEDQLKNLREYARKHSENKDFRYYSKLIDAKAVAAQDNAELIDFNYEYGEDEDTYYFTLSNGGRVDGTLTFK